MRTRNVKPGFFMNEHLAECSAHARLLFIALWCQADCDGRLEDRPPRIRALAFPFEPSLQIESLLGELASRDFITRYSAEGKSVISICKFREHQNPHPKETSVNLPDQPFISAASRLQTPLSYPPSPNHLDSLEPLPSTEADSKPSTGPVLKSRGRQSASAGDPALTDGDRILLVFPVTGRGSAEWYLTEAKVTEYRETFPTLDVMAESRKALQWCRDNPAKRKTQRGMPAFLWRWMERAQNSGRGPAKGEVTARVVEGLEETRKRAARDAANVAPLTEEQRRKIKELAGKTTKGAKP
jgi:hypothetical protein